MVVTHTRIRKRPVVVHARMIWRAGRHLWVVLRESLQSRLRRAVNPLEDHIRLWLLSSGREILIQRLVSSLQRRRLLRMRKHPALVDRVRGRRWILNTGTVHPLVALGGPVGPKPGLLVRRLRWQRLQVRRWPQCSEVFTPWRGSHCCKPSRPGAASSHVGLGWLCDITMHVASRACRPDVLQGNHQLFLVVRFNLHPLEVLRPDIAQQLDRCESIATEDWRVDAEPRSIKETNNVVACA
mmetsp:Transcript_67333/g.187888  ORF Transcript_67333/g.187888 Transcript_67333/m.187888 type:complete len:240 (-) Transcript_67333:107-826(-)